MSFPHYFEDLEIGQCFTSGGRTITETDLTLFSMISGDWNPIHADAEYSKATRYGERIVHGTFGIAIATGLMHSMQVFNGSAIAMASIDSWKFLMPMRIGATIHLRLEITGKSTEPESRSGRIQRLFELIDQESRVIQRGSSDVVVLKRPPPIESSPG